MIPQNRAPPTSSEQYMKNSMQPPANPEAEPWADALDELDPRELAMNRFRTRNEMLEEVFGPEPISESSSIDSGYRADDFRKYTAESRRCMGRIGDGWRDARS